MAILGIGLVIVRSLRSSAYELALGRPFTLPRAQRTFPAPRQRPPNGFPTSTTSSSTAMAGRTRSWTCTALTTPASLQSWRAEAFFVAHRSQSNYAQTALSLASSLNMTDLKQVAAVQGETPATSAPSPA